MQFFELSLLQGLGPHFSKETVLAEPLAWAYVGLPVITNRPVAEHQLHASIVRSRRMDSQANME
jgi:hypothetical protein